MDAATREALDADIRQQVEAGLAEAAVTGAIEGYGAEILGFQVNLMRDVPLAEEAFSLFCEDLWRGLPGFRWQSALRTWLYSLARNAAYRCLGSPHRRAERNLALSASPAVAGAALEVRTRTRPYLRTELKDEVSRLREALPEADQLLLVLRVDRQLSWAEIAEVTLEDADAAALKREAARLRKRFQLVKERLREAAIQGGLLED